MPDLPPIRPLQISKVKTHFHHKPNFFLKLFGFALSIPALTAGSRASLAPHISRSKILKARSEFVFPEKIRRRVEGVGTRQTESDLGFT